MLDQYQRAIDKLHDMLKDRGFTADEMVVALVPVQMLLEEFKGKAAALDQIAAIAEAEKGTQ